MAKRAEGNTKSGLPGSAEFRRHPLIPNDRNIVIGLSSVVLFTRESIRDITCDRFVLVSPSDTTEL